MRVRCPYCWQQYDDRRETHLCPTKEAGPFVPDANDTRPLPGSLLREPVRLCGSKEELKSLLFDFDRIGNLLPVWAMRLINGLRHEWTEAQQQNQVLKVAAATGAMEVVKLEDALESDYVAWLRYDRRKDNPDVPVLVLCDSDAPGAFKVYRRRP